MRLAQESHCRQHSPIDPLTVSRCPQCHKPIPAYAPGQLCPHCLLHTVPTEASSSAVETLPDASESTVVPPTSSPFAAGHILADRYRVVSLLGKGGMGEVYRVDDLTLNEPAALKVLPPHLREQERLMEALRNEVRRARLVSHRHVCRVHDIGTSLKAGQIFVTMEFIDGEDLAHLLKRVGHLPEKKAFQLAQQLAAGMAAAHERDVLHLDLKPANLLIDQLGDVKISDFGLARLRSSKEAIIAGTPAYMAPEQALHGEVSPQTDIYAFGLILFECLVGRRPFPARTLEELRALSQNPQPLPLLNSPGQPSLARVLTRCLEPDPAQRPASFEEVLSELSSPSSALPPSPEPIQDEQLAALLFTDIVGSVGLQQRLGTSAYKRFVERHDEIFLDCLQASRGYEILNETGDGFLVRFPTPSEAIQTALRLQYHFHHASAENQPIGVRIGIHLGVVSQMAERLRGERRAVGMAINLAARIMDLGEGGQILMTQAVYDEARQFVREHPAIASEANFPALEWRDHGAYEFKGSDTPMHVFEVGLPGVAPLVAPEASGKAQPVSPETSSPFTIPATQENAGSLEDSDVYISYAPVDDQSIAPAHEGWISHFHRNLDIRLQQLSGDPIKTWRGQWPLQHDEPDRQVINRLPNIKAMVSVMSPPFVKSARCREEVTAFLSTPQSQAISPERAVRMVKAVKRPVSTSELAPPFSEILGGRMQFEFFERDPDTGRVREFDEAFGTLARQRFQERVYDLAYELSHVLQEASEEISAPTASSSSSKRLTVYLASATSDIHQEHHTIRRELMEQGHQVIPQDGLPMEGHALREAVRECLQTCDLCIQLLGKNYGTIPENAETSIAELQNEVADELPVDAAPRRLIWLPRALEITDSRQEDFLQRVQRADRHGQSVEIIAGALSLFKEVLADRLHPEPPRLAQTDVPGGPETSSRSVYLIGDRQDETALEALEDHLFDQGLEVYVPDFEVDEKAFGEQHRDHLVNCDAVMIYYGKVRKAWVEVNLREVLKASGYGRSHPIVHQCVYVAPPEDRRKERFRTHHAEVVRQPGDAFGPTPELEAFIQKMKEA